MNQAAETRLPRFARGGLAVNQRAPSSAAYVLVPCPLADDGADKVVMDVHLDGHWGTIRQTLGQRSINGRFGPDRQRCCQRIADIQF